MQTIKKGTRYSQIAEYYRRMIDQKTLAVGEKMPTENQICALFQVSRITVREAMNELVKDGYIERIQGKGSYVKAKRVGMQLNHLQGFSEEMRLKANHDAYKLLESAENQLAEASERLRAMRKQLGEDEN